MRSSSSSSRSRSTDIPWMIFSTAIMCIGTRLYVQLAAERKKKQRRKSTPKETSSSSSSSSSSSTTPSTQEESESTTSRTTATTGRPKQVSDDLVCPITLELPFDPVTAEDGRVYERSAIQKHFASKAADAIQSPITNEKMGTKLLPAPQHRNIIEALIDSGTITGDLAQKYLDKLHEKKTMEVLLKRANTCNDTTIDVDAMEQVALNYFRGEHGFPEDDALAFHWFQKAHSHGSVLGTAHMGYMLASGVGVVARHKREGILYLGIAAGKGSDIAAYRLGMAWADGKYGLTTNPTEATAWLKLALSGDCTCRTMNDRATRKAKQKLEEISNRSSSESHLSLD